MILNRFTARNDSIMQMQTVLQTLRFRRSISALLRWRITKTVQDAFLVEHNGKSLVVEEISA
jgi:hypothetical protein